MNQSKPLLILPCSADKAINACAAIDMYQGKGYLPLLKSTLASMGYDYDLAFMSAKYGLIMADKIIEPYEQKLTEESANLLVRKKSHYAGNLITKINPSRIIACLPKLYLQALEEMLRKSCIDIQIDKPPAGGGIGVQRRFLVQQLRSCERTSFHCFVFKQAKNPRIYPSRTTLVKVSVGDIVTPFISGVGKDKIVSGPVTIKAIFIRRGSTHFIDENDKVWHSTSVTLGMSEQEKNLIQTYGGTYEKGANHESITVSLSAIREQIGVRQVNSGIDVNADYASSSQVIKPFLMSACA